ncbi:protein of unknown function (plasmid) [Caballeronia sp. S22]
MYQRAPEANLDLHRSTRAIPRHRARVDRERRAVPRVADRDVLKLIDHLADRDVGDVVGDLVDIVGDIDEVHHGASPNAAARRAIDIRRDPAVHPGRTAAAADGRHRRVIQLAVVFKIGDGDGAHVVSPGWACEQDAGVNARLMPTHTLFSVFPRVPRGTAFRRNRPKRA